MAFLYKVTGGSLKRHLSNVINKEKREGGIKGWGGPYQTAI